MQKRILLISTGGTIAGQTASRTIKKEVIGSNTLADTLDRTIGTIKEAWGIDVKLDDKELCNIDSSNILPEHRTLISSTIYENYDDYDGFIIAHGTNTLGYTASALSFALGKIGKPVVVTGSQVPFHVPGSDALMNLENALRVAVWPYHTIAGVICVFASQILTGCRTKKDSEFEYDSFLPFLSESLGRIGRVILINKDNLDKHLRHIQPFVLNSAHMKLQNNFSTDIVSLTEFPGLSVDYFKILHKEKGVKGFILRSYGAGDASENLRDAFLYLKENEVPIVVGTQAPNGNSNMQVNEPGQYLRKNNLAIPSYDMNVESTFTKLSWLIGQGLSYEQIKIKMLENLHGEINVVEDMK